MNKTSAAVITAILVVVGALAEAQPTAPHGAGDWCDKMRLTEVDFREASLVDVVQYMNDYIGVLGATNSVELRLDVPPKSASESKRGGARQGPTTITLRLAEPTLSELLAQVCAASGVELFVTNGVAVVVSHNSSDRSLTRQNPSGTPKPSSQPAPADQPLVSLVASVRYGREVHGGSSRTLLSAAYPFVIDMALRKGARVEVTSRHLHMAKEGEPLLKTIEYRADNVSIQYKSKRRERQRAEIEWRIEAPAMPAGDERRLLVAFPKSGWEARMPEGVYELEILCPLRVILNTGLTLDQETSASLTVEVTNGDSSPVRDQGAFTAWLWSLWGEYRMTGEMSFAENLKRLLVAPKEFVPSTDSKRVIGTIANDIEMYGIAYDALNEYIFEHLAEPPRRHVVDGEDSFYEAMQTFAKLCAKTGRRNIYAGIPYIKLRSEAAMDAGHRGSVERANSVLTNSTSSATNR